MSQAATSTAPEDEFVCLFSEVFGLEKSQLLVPELGFVNVTGGERRVDFAIKTTEGDVAFEIDGPFHYDSKLITVAQYEDDLLRQNSLITFGWRVFRWTDRQLRRARAGQGAETIAQINHATGTGKTIIASDDAKSLGPRTLYLAHTRGLVKQTRDRFIQFWPESRPGLWLGRIHDDPCEHGVICISGRVSSRPLVTSPPTRSIT